MVRSAIPDSDEDSGDEAAPYDFSKTTRPATGGARAPIIPAAIDNQENGSTRTISTQDDMIGQLLLGTGSTDSTVFQQIYNQHQVSTDATIPTTVSEQNAQHQFLTVLSQPDSTADITKGKQLTPAPLPQTVALSSSASSSPTIRKLKRSKTTVSDSSFISNEYPKMDSKIKRSKSVSRYAHPIEGSSQDITVDVEDTGRITNLSQTSKEYRKMDYGNAQKDVYDFPGSSEPTVITRKIPTKTTMECLNMKTTKTYGKSKVGRSRTMIAPSSSPVTPAVERKRRGSDTGRAMDSSAEKLSSSLIVVHEQAPKRSLKENIQRKKEEKAAAMKQKEDVAMVEAEHTIIVGEPAKVKTPVRTYSEIKRYKTSVSSVSPALIDIVKRSTDDIGLDKHKKRKSDVHIDDEASFELRQAKRYQRSQSMASSPQANNKPKHRSPADIVDLSSSEVNPDDHVLDILVTPTACMPKPLLKSSTGTVLVPATKSQDKSSSSTAPNGKVTTDSHELVIMNSTVSVVKATKSSEREKSPTFHGHPGTPGFDSSQERAETASSVLKKVNELVNSPATGQNSGTSSPLAISFDKGLVGRSIVLIPEPTDSQKEDYQAVSTSSDDEHAVNASLPAVMSAAKVEKWSGTSSTVANSTWKERNSGADSAQQRAPSMEPLSSQLAPSSRKPNKRSKTVTEGDISTRRGRSVSLHSDAPPSSDGSDVVAQSGRNKIGRSKTVASGDEPAKYGSKPRRTHVVKTITTYEKLKDPDEPVLSFPDADPGADVDVTDTQAGSARGTKRKSDAANLDVIHEPQPQESQLKSQEELDLEMARNLQEEIDKEDAEPGTRAKRRGARSTRIVDLEPEPEQSFHDAGLPPPEMYKPRLSSRRSKSLSAKADPSAFETFIDALPRSGRKGKGKQAAKEQAVTAEKSKAKGKENFAPSKKAATINLDASCDNVMENADMLVVDEAPESFFNKEKLIQEIAAPVKNYAVAKQFGRAKSKSSVPAATAAQDEDAEDETVALQKRDRAAQAVINDTDDSGDELMMDVDEEPVKPKDPARGRAAANKKAASITATAKVAPKSKEMVHIENDDGKEMPDKPTGRPCRSKATEKVPADKPLAKSKDIVDTDDDLDDDEEPFKTSNPVKAPTSAPASVPEPTAATTTPLPRSRGIARQKSTPGFRAPTMTRNKSTSVETDVPQTPIKDKEMKGSQELMQKSTPPSIAPHSPLRGGVVPLRVGLSKRTRLPSLLKIIRKDK